MKLKKLTMAAFGSFACKTVVDFESLDSGLYLIRGNTGAGKTTIFDAIVFALYGDSSGGARSLAMMHSDFVSKDTPTEVSLVFEHGGAEYSVTRTQTFSEDGTKTKTYSAKLRESEQPPISGVINVTKRIEELLGLEKDQFRQIVMLAQGAFRQLLEANSQNRAKILSTIFNTSKYRALQERFKAAADRLRKSRDTDEESIRIAIQNLELPDDLDDSERRKLKPVDEAGKVLRSPTFAADLEALLALERQKTDEAERKFSESDKRLQNLNAEKGTAESRNSRLEALEKAKGDKLRLDSRKADMDARADKLARCSRAAAVLGAEKERDKAEGELNEATDKHKQATKELEEATAEANNAAEAVKELEGERGRIQNLATQASNLAKAMDSYAKIGELERKLSALGTQAETAQQKKDTAEAKAKSLEEKIGGINDEIDSLQNAGAEAEKAKGEVDKAVEALREFQTVCNAADETNGMAARLEREQGELRELAKAALECERKWDGLYKAFVRGQAGLMADALATSIRENGHGTCPVCGTTHTAIGACFASKSKDTPTEAEVNAAKTRFDEADGKRAKKKSGVDTLAASFDERRGQVLHDARILAGCGEATWENLTDAAWRDERQAAYENACAVARSRKTEADGKVTRLKDLAKSKGEAENDKRMAVAEAQTAAEEAAECARGAAGVKGELNQWRSQLPYPTREEAERILNKTSEELASLRDRVEKADTRNEKANSNLAACKASLDAFVKQLEKYGKALLQRRSDFLAALASNGYADEAAYKADAALLPPKDISNWLEGIREDCTRYSNAVKNNADQLASLEEETKGYARVDIAELDGRIRQTTAERKAADAERGMRKGFVNAHETALRSINETEKRLKRTEDAMKRLDELSVLANGGRGGDNDRVDFVRYMLGDSLREVLVQANARLDKMSGGQFELVHRAEGKDARSVAGLDIDVLDRTTGTQRLAASFSGGEGFQASMALALGLADTVRNHAGDIQLDSTFIDEGFGSLDDTALENCIRVLKDLAGGERQVGIISHIAKLEEDIWPQIVVEKDIEKGSTLEIRKR